MSQAVEQVPTWSASPKQSAFLRSNAFEALYGGAAGGGKTQALVLGALYDVAHPSYNAIIFRRTFPELEGEVIPVSKQWYPLAGGRYNAVQHCWTFPSGARIHFGHLQHEDDVERYQGWQFQYVGYDELTHFTEKQYTYIANSRVRSADGIIGRVRSGTNPGGPGHEWVKRRWAPWLDRDSEVKAEPTQTLHYRSNGSDAVWCERGVDTLSRAFFPAALKDNPHLVQNDPQYALRLAGLDRVTRAQLLDGNWDVKPSPGAYFQRGWVQFLDAAPARVAARVRSWDLAATAPGEASDPDWTVGVRMVRLEDGSYVVEDVVRKRLSPGNVEGLILSTANLDPPGTSIDIPQDPGQAGKAQAAALIKLLAGFHVQAKPVTGDKVTRFKPFSAQAEAGNVRFVRAPWNLAAVEELEAFPSDGIHDDVVDACSSAFNRIARAVASFGDTEFKSPQFTFGVEPTNEMDGFDVR